MSNFQQENDKKEQKDTWRINLPRTKIEHITEEINQKAHQRQLQRNTQDTEKTAYTNGA